MNKLEMVIDKLSQKNEELTSASLQVARPLEIGQQMSVEEDPTYLVNEYFEVLREVIGARCAGIGILNAEQRSVRQFCTSDLDNGLAAETFSDFQCNGIIREIIEERASSRLRSPAGEYLTLGIPSGFPPIHSFVGVAIASPTRIYGWLALANKLDADEFSQQEEELLSLLAAQLGVNYENARLNQEEKRRTLELEDEVNERKHAEGMMRESEARYRALAEGTTDQIYIVNPDGTFQYINNEGARALGLSPQAIIGKSQSEMFPASTADEHLRTFKKIRETGEPLYDETQRRSQDQEVWLCTWLVPIKDEQGAVSATMGIARDITERKRAEASSAFLASIEAFSDDAIMGKTLDGTIISWNAGAEKIYGYTSEEVKGHNVAMLAHPDRIDEIEKILERLKRGEGVRSFETVRTRKDGQIVQVSLSVSAIEDSHGNITGASTIARDITRRKRAERETAWLLTQLQNQKERIDNIVTNVPGVVWEAWGQPDEATQHIDFVSAYVEKMLGYEIEEWLNTPNFWLTIVHPDDRDQAARDAVSIFEGGSGGVTPFRWITKDGRALWVESHMTVVCDEDGSPIGMRGVTLDITERKRAEEEIIRARNLALDASRIKGEFLDNMSHELRTPMNGIIGLTNLTLETNLTDTQRSYLNMVNESAESLMVLINRILTFSENDPAKLDAVGFCLQERIHESVMAFSEQARRKGLSLIYQIAPNVPKELVGYPDRLNQILKPLVDNAIKFTDQGEVAVVIEQKSRTLNEVCLEFTVRDTGIGIPAEKLELIFDPFTQVDGTRTRRHGGAGLGLAICRQMVEVLGDRIWVESEQDYGSAFHFTVCFREDEQSNAESLTTGNLFDRSYVEKKGSHVLEG